MLDLSSLLIVAGLFLSLVIGDAALNGDTLQVQINVPPKLAQAGFTEAAAEQLFAAEVMRIKQTISLSPAPNVRMTSHPSVLAALGKPLNLDKVVIALQGRFGIDVVSVEGTILAEPASRQLDMTIVMLTTDAAPAKIRLSQADGDADALIEHGARLVLEQLAPYRLVLTDLTEGLAGNAARLEQAKSSATRVLAQPWTPATASERLMLHDLLALIAMAAGDDVEAETQYRAADAVPQASPGARGLIALNRAFLAMAQRRTDDAQAYFNAGAAATARAPVAGWSARLDTLHALVAWSAGDVTQAEQLLRAATAALPHDETAHAYLARLLAAKGDASGAAQQRDAATTTHRPDFELAALAPAIFWVDPVHGGLRRRDERSLDQAANKSGAAP
jgi:hypothetical protein